MRIELEELISQINGRFYEEPVYSILETKEASEEYSRINKTSNKLGDTVVTYHKIKFEPIEI